MTFRLSRVVGAAFRAVFAAILLVRRPRPIHARGRMLRGRIEWIAVAPASGIPWVDRPAGDGADAVARLSRSLGLPAALPDIIGLALRVDTDDGPADIELASTGFGVPGRFVLLPHRRPSRARLSTLLAYRSASGPVLLCARTLAPADLPAGGPELDRALATGWRLRLYWARTTGPWHPFADLTLRPDADAPADLRFDAVRHPIPGAGTYEWASAVRQPSYRLAQRSG